MERKRFIDFLKDLRKSAGKPIVVIVDGGSYHKSKAVREFLKEEGAVQNIRLVLLPPYSPELNPDEQVWNNAKRCLGRMSIKSKGELREAVRKVLESIRNSLALVKSFFQLPDTKYACSSF